MHIHRKLPKKTQRHEECEATSASSSQQQQPVANKPRNFFITEATKPVQFEFTGRYRIHHAVRVQQTADDETWPGGALWDAGWCLTQFIAAAALGTNTTGGPVTTHTSTYTSPSKVEWKRTATTQLPKRVMEALSIHPISECSVILELGCGVGLTGLVAAAALQAKTTILTDLDVVIRNVTLPNVLLNTEVESKKSARRIINKGKGEVIAMPLCWGDTEDAKRLRAFLDGLGQTERNINKQTHKPRSAMPSLVLIGDVAYQHTPGAPSHFEALVSTLKTFVDHNTIVIFATRVRMPASIDLLELLLEHYYEVVQPSLSAEEIEYNVFGNVKHNLSLHFLKLDQGKPTIKN